MNFPAGSIKMIFSACIVARVWERFQFSVHLLDETEDSNAAEGGGIFLRIANRLHSNTSQKTP
jgi:hypothetical protein